jgi:hypothetical protein
MCLKYDDNKYCEKIALELRELIFDDAALFEQGAMCGSIVEIYGFALEWIKKAKGIDYDIRLFEKNTKTNNKVVKNEVQTVRCNNEA